MSDLGIPLVRARYYRPAQRTDGEVLWVVLHSTEGAIRPGAARAVARWFASPASPRASAHYVVDAAEVVQCVEEHDVAFGAPGANTCGIHVEQAGYAIRTDWTSGDGLRVLQRSAPLVAEICARWDLPLQRVDVTGVRSRLRGITSHATTSTALRVAGGHQDPGGPGDAHWPWDLYLDLVWRA